MKEISYFNILAAKKAYIEGKNVTDLLRSQINSQINTPQIIETSYDLQAGSYIENLKQNMLQSELYADEMAELLDTYLSPESTILDVGTGEITTLSLLINRLNTKPKIIYAFDISWSRIFHGIRFAKEVMATDFEKLNCFVADMRYIPFPDKSVDIVISSHSLEPNGGALEGCLIELFRIARNKIILFEPCYEINTEEGKRRMDRLGYIKNLDGVVEKLGGMIIDKVIIKNISNAINPTVGFIIVPTDKIKINIIDDNETKFSVPGANFVLKKIDEFYFSKETGLCFPILKSIPILKLDSAILASSLCDYD